MKIPALFLALAIALPLGASAQVPPPPGDQHRPPMTQAQRQAFEGAMKSFHDKEEQLRKDERKQVLGALSPSSRSLLQQVAGQLATADVPDHKAAVAQLDAKLSGSEKQAILAADTDYHTQSKALFAQFRSQMESMRPSPAPGTPPQAWPSHKPRTGEHHRTPTAGSILLMTALGHGEMHGGMHMMHGDMHDHSQPQH